MSESLKSLAKRITALETFVATLPQPKASRFIDNGDGTVTDKETNLVWMKEDDGKERKWEEAKQYCEKLGNGWRLPTIKELISIIDYERHDPAIDPIFTNTKSSYYWSSTPHASYSDVAWGVYFGNGGVNYWD